MKVVCPVSIGELVDKITILKIKTEKIADKEKQRLAQAEHDALNTTLKELELSDIEDTQNELYQVNLQLWEIEDDIRVKEREKQFDEEFISLARRVYQTNDRRFALKDKINRNHGSEICEVKSYEEF